ncbi:MAG: DUF6316 family protein [Proteobacteria bacterium]|nr:DUF6316 family protein [Pseudomonadota bacterium]
MRPGDVKGDKNRYFRSEARVFNLNGSWYFATRERDQGPFDSRRIADEEAYRYADEQVVLGRFKRSLETERAAHGNFGLGLTMLPLDGSTAGLAMESD